MMRNTNTNIALLQVPPQKVPEYQRTTLVGLELLENEKQKVPEVRYLVETPNVREVRLHVFKGGGGNFHRGPRLPLLSLHNHWLQHGDRGRGDTPGARHLSDGCMTAGGRGACGVQIQQSTPFRKNGGLPKGPVCP